MTIQSKSLTKLESRSLSEYEEIIRNGKESFIKVGQALLNVRDGRLFRDSYVTFEDYCQKKWGFNRTRGQQLIQAAITIAETDGGEAITNERQAREIAKVPKEKRGEVLSRAGASGVPTAASISKAAATKDPIELDKEGRAIPPKALAFWHRSDEVQELLTGFSRIINVVKKAQAAGDPMYAEMNFANTISKMEEAWQDLKRALPYVVCTTCQGHVLSPCQFCHNRGLISKFAWDHQTPTEIKNMIQKGKKK